jgi:undecaprenyl-diphosphatase
MSWIQIVILALIQGLAELLPISSSAHVIVAAKLMKLGVGMDSPEFVLLLVMLHTGTMFAVIVHFWHAWKRAFFSSREALVRFARSVIIATAVTGILALALKFGIEHVIKHQHPGIAKAEVEQLFNHLELIAAGLAAAGALIFWSGVRANAGRAFLPDRGPKTGAPREDLTDRDSLAIGAIQGLCLPFRGFSRSGSTISLGLLRGIAKARAEEFSFALAVVLTPAVVAWEARRLIQHHGAAAGGPTIGLHDFLPSLHGMVFSFIAGLVALRLLSRLLERGKWWVFGIYCLVAAAAVFALYRQGY